MQALLEPRRVAIVLSAAIVLLAILGAIVAWEPRPALARFDLDEERTVPAIFSGLLLAVCAVLALRLPRSILPRGAAIAFAALLALASLDELAEIHEKLERRLDVDWQLLYVPVFLAVLVVLGLFVRGLRRNGLDLRLVVASAASWGSSQVLEALQWEDDGPASGYRWMVVAEETLEMTGSALLLLALLTAVKAGRRVP